MKRLAQAIITMLTLASFSMPAYAFARDPDVIRPDGRSIQNVYSMRGHLIFVNRVSKRHLRLVTVPQPREISLREII